MSLLSCNTASAPKPKQGADPYLANAKANLYTFLPAGQPIARTKLEASATGRSNNELYVTEPAGQTDMLNKVAGAGVVSQLWVDVERIDFVSSATDTIIEMAINRSFDLLALKDDATQLFGEQILPQGNFDQIRLILAPTMGWVRTLDGDFGLIVASGTQTGIKIEGPLEIVSGFLHKIELDFNISNLKYTHGQGYLLTPLIKIKEVQALPPFEPGILLLKLKESVNVIQPTDNNPNPTTGLNTLDELLVKHNVIFMVDVMTDAENSDDQFQRSNFDEAILEEIGVDREYVLGLEAGVDIVLAMYDLWQNEHVEMASPDSLMTIQATYPNDTEAIGEQYNYLASINAYQGWDIETGASNILMAVLDTGIRTDHEDLSGKVREGPHYRYGICWAFIFPYPCIKDRNNDDYTNPHGTMVAGVMGAKTNNNKGISGVNWNSPIIDIGVANRYGSVSDRKVGKGLLAAVNRGVRVVNMSFGEYGYQYCIGSYCRFTKPDMFDFTKLAKNHGVVLVAAAGNDGKKIYTYDEAKRDTQGQFPASFPWVISVGGLKVEKTINSSYNIIYEYKTKHVDSNYGKIDVSAPYDYIYTTSAESSNEYVTKQGTSLSAPMVSGLAGLILSLRPGYTSQQVMDIITSTADDLGATGYDEDTGYGRINIGAALNSILFSVSVGVTGLNSAGLILQMNGGHDLAILQNGQTTFGAGLPNNSTYDITILSHPLTENCTIYNNSGTIQRDDIRNVFVVCTDPTDVTPPAEATNFQIAPLTCGGFDIHWQNPADTDLLGGILVKKAGGYPAHITDGEVLFDTTIITNDNIDFSNLDSTYTDLNVTQGTTYYYGFFVVDTANNVSNGVYGSAKAPVPHPDECSMNIGGGGGGCFVATAAFGTPFVKEVVLLREFRDLFLLNSVTGAEFVRLYYKYSPPFAETIANSAFLRATVRTALYPIVSIAAIIIGKGQLHHYFIIALIIIGALSFPTWRLRRQRLAKG